MKKIILLLVLVGMFGFQSCSGPPGENGYSAESEVFEVNSSFTPSNSFSQTYGLNPVILKSDNILVYELYNTQNGIDTWALLPQVYYFSQGSAQYNYNFSFDQFTILIDANFDRNLLPENFKIGKTFRIVIIPGYTSNKMQTVNNSDYNAVIKAYNINDKEIKVLTAK